MEDSKVAGVVGWLEPWSVKELQRFMGFKNFYRQFIRGFSVVAALLTNLLNGKKQGTIRSCVRHSGG